MNTVEVDNMVSHIRCILDENETHTELSGISGERQLSLEDVIQSHLVSGVDAVTLLAPFSMIECSHSTARADEVLVVPTDMLKLGWVKANSWNIAISQVHDISSPLYKMAKHGRVGSVCNANNPLAFENVENLPYVGVSRTIICFPPIDSESQTQSSIMYAKKASITNGRMNVGSLLYEPSCLYIAGLVCDSMGWAKNRDYKADAMLMLGIQPQMQEQVNG